MGNGMSDRLARIYSEIGLLSEMREGETDPQRHRDLGEELRELHQQARSLEHPSSGAREAELVDSQNANASSGATSVREPDAEVMSGTPGIYRDPWSSGDGTRFFDGALWTRWSQSGDGPNLSAEDCGRLVPDAAELIENPISGVQTTPSSEPPSQPTAAPIEPGMRQDERERSGLVVAAFVGGIVSIFAFTIGVIPIATVIVAVIALARFDARRHKGRWMAWTGLVLGGVYTFAYLEYYGHIVL